MTPEQKRVYDGVKSGKTVREMAGILGLTYECAKSRFKRAKKWIEADPSAQIAATASGAHVMPHSYWIKKDGVSAYYQTPRESSTDDMLDRVAEAFKDIPTYEPKLHDAVHNDLMTVYPLYDVHAGMLAWGKETGGQDYDLDLFKSDLIRAVETVSQRSPASSHALVIFGGDTLHVDDYSNETPASRHKQDADGRFEKITEVAIEAICHTIEALAERHARVSVVVLRGNHDESSHIVLKAALKQRYRTSDRISFCPMYRDILWHRHGKCLIVAHHGDRMKPERLAMIAADQCPDWSNTRYRVALTGHLHHLKVQDFPGLTHYTMRAFAPCDAYGSSFGGVRGITSMTFDAETGLSVTAHDPIERG